MIPRTLHSFPTRRSSDLRAHARHARLVGEHVGLPDDGARAELRQRELLAVALLEDLDEALGHDEGARARLTLAHEDRSEEHTSELQSQFHLVCRLLLEKK